MLFGILIFGLILWVVIALATRFQNHPKDSSEIFSEAEDRPSSPFSYKLQITTASNLELSEEQKARQKSEPASWRQKLFIERLGASVPPRLTKYDASALIDRLQSDPKKIERARIIYEKEGYPPSPRQRMVARFWNAAIHNTLAAQVEWTDAFYSADPDRLAAWELWKKENPAESESDDPLRVPLGLGPKYLEQAKSLRLDKERRRKERKFEEKLRLKRRAERELSRLNRPPKPVKENPILRTDNASGFRGVYKTGDRFRAQIGFEGKKYKLGYFDTAEEAAKAYDEAAIKFLGDTARTNFRQG